jgi:hypothetical protein
VLGLKLCLARDAVDAGIGDRLIKDLSERLRMRLEPGDPAVILDAETLSLARTLGETLTKDYGEVPPADFAQTLSVLVAAHWARYKLLPEGQDQSDLQACLQWSAALLPIAPHLVPQPVRAYLAGSDTHVVPAEAAARATSLHHDYKRTGNNQLLQTAITLFSHAIDATPVGHPSRPAMLSNLGNALQSRFERTGQLADLDQAITLHQEAIAAALADHPGRPAMLSNLGTALRTRFERTGQLADLDRAIDLFREAVTAIPADDPSRPAFLSKLGAALLSRFERTGQLADLDQAITIGCAGIDAIPVDHPSWPERLSGLGSVMQLRFRHSRDLADLDQAITAHQRAVTATPPGHPDRLDRLSFLGTALQSRFERTGQLADLDRAIDLFREAVTATPADSPNRHRHVSNLGLALWTRFRRTGQQADLDQAITADQEAIDAASEDDPADLSNLGNALLSRFERTGQLADLDRAIDLFREAVTATPADNPGRPAFLSNLGNALQSRFRRTGQQADVDQAITADQEAIDTTPADHPNRPAYQSNLGNALQSRFECTGQQADLDHAITTAEEAIAASPAGHPDQPRYLSNLGAALQARFGRTGQQADLDRAITTGEEAIAASPAGHPDRSRFLLNLGTALRTRFEATGQRADLEQALEVFREGARVLTASPGQRVAAAQRWSQCALLAGNPQSAVKGYTTAIELLPVVAWHGLDQETREYRLREWAGLASDAAAAAVTAGDAIRAVELLEAGRSVLWTEASQLRQDLAALQDQAPDLAAVLEASRAVLNNPSVISARDRNTAGDAEQIQHAEQQMLEGLRQAARDWDAAVDQIRRIEGFAHFLGPVPFTELRAASSDGPVVIVNISQHASYALIVTPATEPDTRPAVRIVDLLAAPVNAVITQANTLLGALARASDPSSGWQAKEADRHAVFDVLAWCWEAITEPVLAALGHTRTPLGRVEDWPRVWWSPTGPAAVLPLHAAGRHPRTITQYKAMGESAALADTVAGRVISSYTPTLTVLTRARDRPEPGRVRQLAVGVPGAPSYAPGASPLPAVPDELQYLAGYLPTPEHATHLIGPKATRQAVFEALPAHSWLHLSCHGVQHPADAAMSAFLLYDQPLTLAELAALDLRETDLAYLAACQTATGDLRLLDEALHLAGALELIGYRHVLATLWSIADAAAPAMADITYAHLLHPEPDHPDLADQPEAARAPYALHHAVTYLRQAAPDEPLLWAPYIHLGP